MTSEHEQRLHYQLFKLIEQNPDISQRQLAKQLGLSLGKLNYCMRTLVTKGLVKVQNFRGHNNKLAYTYLLTPKGIETKIRMTYQFFQQAEAEYESLKQEIERLGLGGAGRAEKSC